MIPGFQKGSQVIVGISAHRRLGVDYEFVEQSAL